MNNQEVTTNLNKPKRLKKGDTIGLIAPGSFIRIDQLERAKQKVESLGYKAYNTKNILKKTGYFSANDKLRADDINHMFANNKVDGILCVRGGYGCNRILDILDYALISKNPKILMGYSDITSLFQAIYRYSNVPGFHVAVGISSFNNYTRKHLKAVVSNPSDNYVIEYEKEKGKASDSDYNSYIINNGIAQGELIGGNLSLMVSLIGTQFDIDYTGKLIFIEEIEEYPYKIDRMLTQLLMSGKLQKAAGIILGVFRKCDIDGVDTKTEDSFSLKEILIDRLSNLNIPIMYGFPFGHVKNKATLPVGIKAKLNTYNKTITLLEKAVL